MAGGNPGKQGTQMIAIALILALTAAFAFGVYVGYQLNIAPLVPDFDERMANAAAVEADLVLKG